MPGFEQLSDAIQNPIIPIHPDDTAFADEDLSDESALAIVLQDTTTAENYLQAKSQCGQWWKRHQASTNSRRRQ